MYAYVNRNISLRLTIQYNTIQYNTIQYNTIQYNTIQYNTIYSVETGSNHAVETHCYRIHEKY